MLGGVAAAVAVWWLAGPLAAIPMTVDTGGGPTPIGGVAVVIAELAAGLAG